MTRSPLAGKPILCMALLSLLGLAPGSEATNGYFTHGYGTTNKGLAGAGVALPQDAMTPATNPAGSAFLDKQYYAGFAVFNPNRQYTVEGNPSGFPGTFGLLPGTVKSDSEYFFIPGLAANWRISEASAYSLTIYGHGGMNTDYPTNTFYGTSPTGVNLSQLFVGNTYGYNFGGDHAVGVSLIFAYQQFEIKGVQAFALFSSDPANLSNNGTDSSIGWGFKLGYLGRFGDVFSIGLSYQSEIGMDEFDKYAGLFAEQGGFDIPSSWTAGIAWDVTEAVTFVFDVQGINYTDVASVSNSFLPNLALTRLGDNGGAGFGWEDILVYKGGFQWASSDAWVWRLGYSHCEQPIPDTEVLFNILAPGVMQEHITAGFTWTSSGGNKLHVALMHALSESVEGPNPLEAPLPGQQTIELEMDQWELELSYSFGF